MNLENRIEQAFSNRVRPERVVTSDYPDDVLLSDSLYSDSLYFDKRDWRTLTADELERYFEAIFGFTPLAFCYFLPGILCASIREERPDLIVNDSLIHQLDRSPDISNWDTFFLQRWTLLTPVECAAVQEWILWLTKYDNHPVAQVSLTRAYETLALLIKEHERLKN